MNTFNGLGKLLRISLDNQRVEMISGNFIDGYPDGECVKTSV